MCGEYQRLQIVKILVLGSPPRVRGIPLRTNPIHHHYRITPACAGNTLYLHISCYIQLDHPRVCGEYNGKHRLMPLPLGSPPRVRGIHLGASKASSDGRITPACAGNTNWPLASPVMSQDHPRVCGEYRPNTDLQAVKWGSPPRVRGIPKFIILRISAVGITPACAGNTLRLTLISTVTRDHPRVCGEYQLDSANHQAYCGSPPRVRGIPVTISGWQINVGITPACAGNTDGKPRRLYNREDHPRVCGEYTKQIPSNRHSTIANFAFYMTLTPARTHAQPCSSATMSLNS